MTTRTPPTTAARPIAERVEPGAAARSRLPGADYADAFRIASDLDAPAVAWARRAFEGGPPVARRAFRLLAWRGLLGMRLAAEGAPGHLAGWTVLVEEPSVVVMRVRSWMLTGGLVTETTATGTTITTLLRFDRPVARVVWAGAGHLHRAMMPGVLARAGRTLAREARGPVPDRR